VQITLDELKAENAAKEAEANNEPIEDKKEIIEDEYVEVKEESKADDVESSTEDNAEKEAELESWQLTEDTETSEDDQKSGFKPNHEAAKRRKQAKALKGELKEKDSELEELRKQVEALKNGNAPQAAAPKQLTRPTREQFDYDDDAYDAALEKYYDDKLEQKLSSHQSNTTEKQQAEAQQRKAAEAQQKSLDDHYERASQLVADGKVTADSYRSADTVVRQSLESMFPEQGDYMANTLISTLNSLGEGSEKVMYQLGVNPAKMQELQNKLTLDPSGLAAATFLGQLQAQIQTPSKRRSQAPKPSAKADGEGGNSGRGGTLLKQYGKTDDLQTRMNLKRKAKSQGIDTSNW
jgi:hypothetical protein